MGVTLEQKSSRLLKHIRLFVFIIISAYYLFTMATESTWKQVFIFIAIAIFTLNHFLIFREGMRRYVFHLIALDFIVAALFGFIFGHSGYYLVYYNVISVTLFLETSNPKIIKPFIIAFFITWCSIIVYHHGQMGIWDLSSNLFNFTFVLFGAIVGNLVNQLTEARETVRAQYDHLNQSHKELKYAHDQLSNYSQQVETLTTIRERNRIAREIHDTVGHKMTALIIQLQLAGEFEKQNKAKELSETIAKSEAVAREALQEIRLSVQTLREEDDHTQTFIQSLQHLLQDFTAIGNIKTKLRIQGDPSRISTSLEPTLIRVIQESLTNATRHGEATECEVKLSCQEDSILCRIIDNGTGTAQITPGFGLVNMRERVIEHGGKLRIESEEKHGFSVIAEFPLKEFQWTSGGVS